MLRLYWTQPLVTYQGVYEQANNVGINPRPHRQIPIWIGGWEEKVLDRTVRLADGWAPMGHPEDLKPKLNDFRDKLVLYQRNPDNFPIMGGFGARMRRSVGMDHDEWRQIIKDWRALDVTHLAFGTMGQGCVTVDDHIKQLTIFQEMVQSS